MLQGLEDSKRACKVHLSSLATWRREGQRATEQTTRAIARRRRQCLMRNRADAERPGGGGDSTSIGTRLVGRTDYPQVGDAPAEECINQNIQQVKGRFHIVKEERYPRRGSHLARCTRRREILTKLSTQGWKWFAFAT
eukprot:1566437-Pleurochrysis_carterae.AAC.2